MIALAVHALFWGAFAFAGWSLVDSLRHALPTILEAIERETEEHGA